MPAHFEVTDKAVLHDVVVKYPLGTWIVSGNDELVINHIPFLLDPDQGGHGMLLGHVARANPVWKHAHAAKWEEVVIGCYTLARRLQTRQCLHAIETVE
ncbi:MAG TPA: FMN-binding negative transcriptional regulator [Steroidobacteraceae bacterium]|nr:FMN-binding negative transcriptional regulator [Steroidobacteraceae bacterium]